jgi:phosphate starvation-inducible protein PhoH
MTRVGDNSRIIFCGDAAQTDLIKTNEKNGILDFMRIMEQMNEQFSMIEFGVDDIVRSGLVRDYIITKLALGL